MSYLESYNAWLTDDYFDSETRAELQALAGNETEIEDRFHKSLAFGTGGLRGILGAGTNRMNIYTVSKATQGLAAYILKQGPAFAQKGVVIAHDSRRFSPEFCLRAALTLNANGIPTYLFNSLRPTPVLSFALRKLGCCAGIVITASHNPKDYNGYKAYWADGGQVVFPMDEEIIQEVNSISDFRDIKYMTKEDAEAAGLLRTVPQEVDEAYLKHVNAQIRNPELVKRTGGSLRIVYSPFNGAGNLFVRRALAEAGFTDVHIVREQEQPDPDFPTLAYPNPEDPAAFELAANLAAQTDADVILATDPDSDRLGVMVKHQGGYRFLTGNMIGTLMAEYILSHGTSTATAPPGAAVVSTIVSSRLAREIALCHGAEYFEVLTGFKYIAEKIKWFEQTGNHRFVFGYEESIGFLTGDYTRDKDAVSAAVLFCEIALSLKNRGMSVCDGLNEMYDKYGYYLEKTEAIVLKGLDGLAKIIAIMTGLRENPPHSVGGVRVVAIKDCKTNVFKNMLTGACGATGLPESDVFYCQLEDSSWFCARPSGTEPKIKIYCGVKGADADDARTRLDKLAAAVKQITS